MKPSKQILTHKLRSLAIAGFVALVWAPGSGRAVDNSTGVSAETAEICFQALLLCSISCDAAKYTPTQRADCQEGCAASYGRCDPLAAKRGGAQQGVGDVGTGGVLREETVKKKKKRKTGEKQ